jgi:hypothetical protein
MKKNPSSLPAAISIVLLLLLFLECSITPNKITNPSQKDPLAAIKQKIISAAQSIQLEVQNFRGKNFKRPVLVSVLTRSQYAALVGGQTDTVSQSDKDQYNRILRLEGLLRPNADFYSNYDSTISTETAGFYVPGTDSMYIILGDTATGLSFDDSVTIFHEFVHALQDQYFDLTSISDPYSPSDEYFATRYVVEGEAELMENYYAYKLTVGAYPTSATPIINQLNLDQIYADTQLDSVHEAGVPLLTIMPFEWEYYSYGPKFINAIAGMNWSIIDNTIFTALPLRMLEILHPQEYSASNEYLLNTQNLENAIGQSYVFTPPYGEEDELGELLSDVMFREWDFSSFAAICDGMMADKIIVFRDLHADSLRMIWYTYWQDSSASSAFFGNYVSLVNAKRNIQLPPAVDSTTYAYVNDTLNSIYIEQSKSYVFTIENYKKSDLNNLIVNCRAVNPYLNGSLTKMRVLSNKKYPHINKNRLVHLKYHPFR